MFGLKHLIQVATGIGTTSTCIDNVFTDYDGNIMVNTVETHTYIRSPGANCLESSC